MTTDSMNDCRNFGGFTWGRPHIDNNCSITSDLLFLGGTDFYKYSASYLSSSDHSVQISNASDMNLGDSAT